VTARAECPCERIVLAVTCLTLAIGASSCLLFAQAAPAATRDTTLRVAAIRSVIDSLHVRVRVDPEPLPITADTVARGVDPGASRALADQLANLANIAKRAADESVRLRCAGTMVPYSPQGSHRGCPSTPEGILVLGTPRTVPGARTTIRMLVTYIGPHGFNSTLYDYVFRQTATAWLLDSRTALLILE